MEKSVEKWRNQLKSFKSTHVVFLVPLSERGASPQSSTDFFFSEEAHPGNLSRKTIYYIYIILSTYYSFPPLIVRLLLIFCNVIVIYFFVAHLNAPLR